LLLDTPFAMSRIARIVLEGVPYHVTQRGNGRQQVFFEERDYSLYLDLLDTYCQDARLRIWAYCLMPNHVHLIVFPERSTAMAQALGRTHANFARYYNLRKRECGHVWQARYFSTPLEAAHLWRAMAYVERNPVRAGLVGYAEEYAWGSARLRGGYVQNRGLLDLAPWQVEYDWARWREVLKTNIDEEAFGRRLQEASRRGRPFGGERFAEELEAHCGRKLLALPVGRPKKKASVGGDELSLGFGV
jgi:putative transposase